MEIETSAIRPGDRVLIVDDLIATVIGPILTGVDKPIQICSTGSTVNDILNMAVIAACKLGQTV